MEKKRKADDNLLEVVKPTTGSSSLQIQCSTVDKPQKLNPIKHTRLAKPAPGAKTLRTGTCRT